MKNNSVEHRLMHCPRCESTQLFTIERVLWWFGHLSCNNCRWGFYEMWSYINRVGR